MYIILINHIITQTNKGHSEEYSTIGNWTKVILLQHYKMKEIKPHPQHEEIMLQTTISKDGKLYLNTCISISKVIFAFVYMHMPWDGLILDAVAHLEYIPMQNLDLARNHYQLVDNR